jgi:hypothetical protein
VFRNAVLLAPLHAVASDVIITELKLSGDLLAICAKANNRKQFRRMLRLLIRVSSVPIRGGKVIFLAPLRRGDVLNVVLSGLSETGNLSQFVPRQTMGKQFHADGTGRLSVC